MGDPNVKSIFVNIFGGIARCDHIAEAVVSYRNKSYRICIFVCYSNNNHRKIMWAYI